MQDTWSSVSTAAKRIVTIVCFFSKGGQHAGSKTCRRIAHLAWEHMDTPYLHCPQIIKWFQSSSGCSIICTITELYLGRELAAGPVTSPFATALHLSENKQCVWIKHNLSIPLFCALFLPNMHLFGIKNNGGNKNKTKWRGIFCNFGGL